MSLTKDDHINYERLTESDPIQFLDILPGLMSANLPPDDLIQMDYLEARALARLHRYSEAEQKALALLSKAVEEVDHQFIAKANMVLSVCYSGGEQAYKQKPCLDMAIDAARSSRKERLIIECLSLLAHYYLTRNDRNNSLKYFHKAEKMSENINDPDIRLKILIDIGSAYRSFNEFPKAIAYKSTALKLAQEINDPFRQLLIINNLSTLYTNMDRFSEAEDLINQGLKIVDDHVIPVRKIMLLFNLGCLYMRQDRFQNAIDSFNQCYEFSQSVGFNDPKYLQELYSNLAGCHRYMNQGDIALQYIEQAEEIIKSMNDPMEMSSLELNKANLLISINRQDEAKPLLEKARKYFRRHNKYELLIIAQMNLASFYESKKDLPHVIHILKEVPHLYSEYMRSLVSEKTEEYDRRIKDLMASYDQVQDDFNRVTTRFREKIVMDFVGQSTQHRKVLESALMAAQHPDTNVIITGESGTGKEILANLIHLHSMRSTFPFVAVNVSAVTGTLIESEFFGHKKGSFTGAISDHTGYFMQAHRGSLYLDEIADMPVELQSKLLRVLETRKVTPVGSQTTQAFDCRVISSTNKDIMELMKKNQFRLDLFHRLNTIEIHIPPLRSRPEDIDMLTYFYAEYFAKQNNRRKPLIEDSFLERFRQYSFPGNVRELRNLIERLFILNPSDVWDEDALVWLPIRSDGYSSEVTLTQANQQSERELIINALQQAEGKQKDAAKLLGISESTLTRRVVKYHLEIYTRKGR